MSSKRRTSLHRPVILETPASVSALAQGACAQFGLITRHACALGPKTTLPSAQLLRQIQNANTILLTGSSGAGKSCLLRGIADALRRAHNRTHLVENPPTLPSASRSTRSILDRLVGPLERRVSTLSYAGLAEPKLWAMPYSSLSAGEQARFQLALIMQRAKPGDVLLADEFCTPLDRLSAHALACTIGRWSKRNAIKLIVATAHEDMATLLEPDLLIDASSQAVIAPPRIPMPMSISIEQGTIADYHQLAHLHYRGSKPATHTMILRAMRSPPTHPTQSARSSQCPILAGVLMISMPTLNGAWRERAWPGHFSRGSKSENAKRINRDLRCISRVIIDPRSRGLGIASALVRRYLSCPQTPATESIAAMGSVCPFFERAGMRPYTLLPTHDDLRLLDALDHEQRSPADLANPNNLIAKPIDHHSFLARELHRWGKRRKIVAPQTPIEESIQAIAPIAACRLVSKPRAYAHVFAQGADRDEHRTKE